jgi:hypothetical protein
MSTTFQRSWLKKYKVGKDGLKQRHNLPKSFDAIIELTKEARMVEGKLGRFIQFYRFNPERLEDVFRKSEQEWTFTPPSLPK